MSRHLLLAVCFTVLSLGARAADGPFPREVAPHDGDDAAAQTTEKRAPGCDVAVESDAHHKRVTDLATGKQYTITYLDDGRISNYESASAKFSVVYANARPLAVVEAVSGQVFNVHSGKGADWYANLRLQGKFPSPAKLVERICSSKDDKLTIAEQDLPTDMMTTDYWDAEFSGSDWPIDFAAFAPTPECLGGLINCLGICDDRADIQTNSCIIQGAIWSAIAGPEVGAIIGIVCQIGSTDEKQRCHRVCSSDFPC